MHLVGKFSDVAHATWTSIVPKVINGNGLYPKMKGLKAFVGVLWREHHMRTGTHKKGLRVCI